MKQTITINCPDGKKAVYNEKTHIVDFVDITTRSKSWEEFCKNHPDTKGEYAVLADSICNTGNSKLRGDSAWYTLFKTKEDAEGIVAFMKLVRLHDEWVEGIHRPQIVSAIYYDYIYDKFDVLNSSHILWFPNTKLALEFLDCHRDLIKKAKRFI